MKDEANVIPFPKQSNAQNTPSASPVQSSPIRQRFNHSLVLTGASLFAIAVAVGSTNYALAPQVEPDRKIASVSDRNAEWEKALSESLASVEVRGPTSIGKAPSMDEVVRYGVLERKYTVLRDLQRDEVESITLQSDRAEASLIKDRAQFLGMYGKWMTNNYGSSKLKTSGLSENGQFELFTIYDSKSAPYGEARFELDTYGHLISFRFKPIQ